MLKTYRKKPVEIEAVRFIGSSTHCGVIEHWMETGDYQDSQMHTSDMTVLEIDTLEGVMTAQPGDYIIKGVQGEFYPCKPDIFEQTYEEAR